MATVRCIKLLYQVDEVVWVITMWQLHHFWSRYLCHIAVSDCERK